MYFLSQGGVDIFLTIEKAKVGHKDEEHGIKGSYNGGSHGEVEKKEIRIDRLREGSYFGEIALITKLKRTATARAIDYTTLAYID